ncbi:MAG: glucose-6-phosphate isomerase [Spirochaetaceae bacterium]
MLLKRRDTVTDPRTGKNLIECAAFEHLNRNKPAEIRQELTAERVASYDVDAGGGLRFNYAASAVDDSVMSDLEALCTEQKLLEQYQTLYEGGIMNVGEERLVLHHLLRGRLGSSVSVDGSDIGAFYREQTERVAAFARAVHAGEILGSTGKQFRTVVQIGIGGSDLGPRALAIALSGYAATRHGHPRMHAEFISNVDPDDAASVLQNFDPETTLFVLVSKSGTTQETLSNELFAIELMERYEISGLAPRKHMVAVTSRTSPLAQSSEYLDAFFIDDYIGGRYSGTSPVGGVILSLAFGPEIFEELLSGAHEADSAATRPFAENAAMIDAAIGVYNRNVLGFPTTAVLPYSNALMRFPAHLQQLDMESNGKRVNRRGEPLSYATGPVVFGEPGTNGQHSFYQLLHQGTDIVPMQFIGFRESQRNDDITVDGSTSQTKLNANLAAQIGAFAFGQDHENQNKAFPGNRPSSLLYGKQLTPRALGALLAHYENKIMFQGFLWNINSFDQEGVQLGKVLTKSILSGDSLNPAMEAYTKLLGVR